MNSTDNNTTSAKGAKFPVKEIVINDFTAAYSDFHLAVEGYMEQGGAKQPVEVISDLLNAFFSGRDRYETDDKEKLIPYYMGYNDEYIADLIYSSMETIKFFVELERSFDRLRLVNPDLCRKVKRWRENK